MSSASVILTHGDLDGMVCGILLLKSLPTAEADIRITNGTHLHRELGRLAAEKASGPEVFISDIPLLASRRSEVLEGLRSLCSQGARVHLYDHHLGWERAPEVGGLCEMYCVDTAKTTAAALVWRERLRGDGESQQWLRLLSEKSGSADAAVREHFGVLAALMQPSHYGHTAGALRALASGNTTADCRHLSQWYYDVHIPREQELARSAQVLTTASGRRLGWLDLRSETGFYMVAPLIIAEHGVDVVATVTKREIVVGGFSIDQGVDLSSLHGEHEVGDVGIRVGGHKSPVSLTPIGARTVTDAFVEAARRLLTDAL